MRIAAIETAVPDFKADPEAIAQAGRKWLNQDSTEYALFERYLRSSKICGPKIGRKSLLGDHTLCNQSIFHGKPGSYR